MAAPLERQVFYSVLIGGKTFDVTGRKRTPSGYITLCIKDHPNCDVQGYIFEHRIIKEKHLGRFLTSDEVVHHLNDIKHDNRLNNLKVMSHGKHTTLHHTGNKRSKKTRELMSLKMKARLKNKRNHPTYKDVDDELAKLYKEGFNNTEIAKKLGITRHTVGNKIKYLKLER